MNGVAACLVDAYRRHARIPAAPESGPADVAAAYAAQDAVWQAMAGGQRPTAWKLGASVREAEPVAAPVFPSRLAIGPAELPGALFTGLGVEAEIALRFGRDLPARARPYGRDELFDAIASVHVAMELVDTRLADPEAAGPFWRLADNLLNGALVVGDAIADWRRLDWSAQAAGIELDGQALAVPAGQPPLGDLFHCLPWWLGHVGGARAGDIVTTGAWSGMHPAWAATGLAVVFRGLGRAVARVGPRPAG